MFQSGFIIARFRGPWRVPIEIDQSLLLLVGVILYFSLNSGLMQGAIFAAMLVLSILLHELGHAWGCLIQGIPVTRVLLWGGGGLCFPASHAMPREQEFYIAMGPLVNLALWALAGLGQWALWTYVQNDPMLILRGWVYDVDAALGLFARLNLILFAFNLIPVQPMDGGRLTHLILLRWLPAAMAHRVAGGIGLVTSILWIPLAIWAFVTYGFILFFMPSIRGHYRMMRGGLST